MTDTPHATQPDADSEPDRAASWLDADVDGRPVKFWIAVATAIAIVTLGFGAFWVWGLDRGMQMASDPAGQDGQMAGMASTDVRLPAVAGLYEGQRIFFVHPEASDPDVAGMLTDMMGGSPVLTVPSLADIPPSATDELYVFTNGVEGSGPFGFQPDVFPSVPGEDAYRPLRNIVLVTWADDSRPRELRSAQDVHAAADTGEITLEDSGVVANMPIIDWPGGQR